MNVRKIGLAKVTIVSLWNNIGLHMGSGAGLHMGSGAPERPRVVRAQLVQKWARNREFAI